MNKPKPAYTSVFLSAALNEINREIAKAQHRGVKSYFTKEQAAKVYHRHKGNCGICGGPLLKSGKKNSSARFMLMVPLRNGGRAELDNLILVCISCKREYTAYPRVKGRVEGYNSLADIIVSLVESVINKKDTKDIQIIKSDLNACVSEYINSLSYLPRAELRDSNHVPIVDNENTIGDLVVKAAQGEDIKEDLKETIDTISMTRRYIILRNTNDS